MLDKDIERVIYTPEQIQDRVKEIARRINEDFTGEEVVVIAVLRGAVIFFSDIFRKLTLDCEADFISVGSYGKGATSGKLELKKDITADIKGKNVIIVEDILDTGKTLKFICDLLSQREPKALRVCVLLDKKCEKQSEVKADYVGFEVDDTFVVGYGLDYADRYRNLPYIGELKTDIWRK